MAQQAMKQQQPQLAGQQHPMAMYPPRLYQLVQDLGVKDKREAALLELSKKRVSPPAPFSLSHPALFFFFLSLTHTCIFCISGLSLFLYIVQSFLSLTLSCLFLCFSSSAGGISGSSTYLVAFLRDDSSSIARNYFDLSTFISTSTHPIDIESML